MQESLGAGTPRSETERRQETRVSPMTYPEKETTTAAAGDAGSIAEAAPVPRIATIPRNVHSDRRRKGRVRARGDAVGLPVSPGASFGPTKDKGELQ